MDQGPFKQSAKQLGDQVLCPDGGPRCTCQLAKYFHSGDSGRNMSQR